MLVLTLLIAACDTASTSTTSSTLAAGAPTTKAAPTSPEVVVATHPEVVVTTQLDGEHVAVAESGKNQCEDGRITFEHAPVDIDLIEVVTPLGLMSGSHVTPVDHQYFQDFKEPDQDISVFSPAAGVVTDIQHMSQTISDGDSQKIDDYRLVIEHTCSISSIFIHVGTLTGPLVDAAPPPGEHASVAVSVAAGEKIGSFRMNVDYSVVDLDVVLPGLLVPEHYDREPWKIHSPDPFDYFTPEIRSALVAKSLRVAEPLGGQFAYDIDGRLVGNWFLEGTNGYGGADLDRYWAGHLAIAYDLFDPDQIVVSIGTFDGASAQFGVRGNGPDPEDVSFGSGPVVYELVDYDYFANGERWDRVSLVRGIDARSNDAPVHGVAVFELVSDRVLKAEFFPGVVAAEVGGFTGGSLVYER